MPTREYREVNFHKYCPKCKYWDIEEIMDPFPGCIMECLTTIGVVIFGKLDDWNSYILSRHYTMG